MVAKMERPHFSNSLHPSLIFICFRQKHPIKVQIIRLSTARMKINQIPYVVFQASCQFSFKFASPFSVMTHNSSEIFKLQHCSVCFGKKESISAQFFRLLSALMKVNPSLYAVFETTSSRFIQILNYCSVL